MSIIKAFLLVLMASLPLVKFAEGISTDSCDKTVGCLRFPSGCNGKNCDYAATYSYNSSTNFVTIEMFGKDAAWVAIGFSDDQKMPSTHAVFCYNSNDNVSIESSYLQSRGPPTLEKENDLNLLENSTDGGISCKFTHPVIPGNKSTLRSLNQTVYLLYAKGLISGDTPNQHGGMESDRGFSAELVNLTIATPLESGFTSSTSSTPTKPTAAAKGISTDGCTKTVGCLRFPSGCSGGSCDYAATYSYNSSTNLLTIEMFGKDAAWVALGFSDDQRMPNTHAVFCYNSSDNVSIESSYLQTRGAPTLVKENDLNLLESSKDGGISCKFTHPLIPGNESSLRSLNQTVYLLYAKGLVSGGRPNQHRTMKSDRGFSAELVNLTTPLESGFTSSTSSTPTEPTTAAKVNSTDGCMKTVGRLRFPLACSGRSCDYAATYSYNSSTNLLTIEMFGKDAAWVALGFSDDQRMPNTHAVFCYNSNGMVSLESSHLQTRGPPTLVKENDLNLLESSMDGGISCKFTHPLIPGNKSSLRSLNQTVYLLYAKGLVSGGRPNQHGTMKSDRGFSAELVNLTTPLYCVESGFTSSTSSTSSTPTEPTTAAKGISTDGCTKTVGCLRFPSGCSGGSCDYAATYGYNPSTSLLTIEIFGKNAAWVALGFSDDQKMPNTDAVFCYNSNGMVSLESSNLQDRGPPSLVKESDLNLLASSIDGGISCKFTHPLTPGNRSTLRSLDQKIYLLYAKGPVSSGNPSQHSGGESSRGFSADLVNLTTTFESVTASPSQLKKKVHGSLMAIVWILLASSGLFFARYTRSNWPNTKLLGTKVWFQLHRLLMIIVVLGTIASIVIIFVDLDGFTEQEGKVKTHAIIGLVVLALAVLQPIGALFRPHPDASKRPIFNFFHRALGVSAFVLAIVTIILGLDIFEKDEAYYTVIGYAGFLAGVILMMEISKYLYDRSEESIEEATVPGGMQMQGGIAVKKSSHLTLSQIFLAMLDIVSLAVTVAVISFIYQDDED